MDITDFRSLATVLCFIALAGVFYWTYHPKRKKTYDEAAQLPFDDDEQNEMQSVAVDKESKK